MKTRTHAAIIFSIGFSLWFFLIQNLPFTLGDDLNVISFSIQKNWATLIKAFLNPLTPALYVHGEISLETTRTLQPILFKLCHQIFGYSAPAFDMIKIIGMALTGTFVFLWIQKLNKNTFISYLGTLIFLTAAPLYRGVNWIADLDILAQWGTIAASYLFISYYISSTENSNRNKQSTSRFIYTLLGIICFYWIGMKLKETGRLFPLIALCFILVDQNVRLFSWFKSSKKNLALFSAVSLLIFTVIPVSTQHTVIDERASSVTSAFQINNIPYALWNNPLSNHIPSDLASMLFWGLFLLTPILFLFIFIQWLRKKLARNHFQLILFTLIWSSAALCALCLGFHLTENERYLSTLIVPFILFLFLLISSTSSFLSKKAKTLFLLTIFILSVIPIQRNIDSIVFIKKLYDNRNIADWKGTQIIFEDLYNKEATAENLVDFYQGNPPYSKKLFHESRVKQWDSSVASDINTVRKIAKDWGSAFVISFDKNLYTNENDVTLIKESDTRIGSLYTTLMPLIKKKSLQKFYVYRITS